MNLPCPHGHSKIKLKTSPPAPESGGRGINQQQNVSLLKTRRKGNEEHQQAPPANGRKQESGGVYSFDPAHGCGSVPIRVKWRDRFKDIYIVDGKKVIKE